MRSLYLINPRPSSPVYYGVDFVGESTGTPIAMAADLAVTTVAAMAAPHLKVALVDEAIAPADLDARPDYVGITGKYNQSRRMLELARHYRSHGCTVVMGGPYVSLAPERFRAHCDVLVEGEMESIAERLFSDLARGRPAASYRGERIGLESSPIPRWDLYPNERAILGCLQTSRGCPFECEFCDVIQYLGRKQRFKPIASVLAELDVLYAQGYQRILLADDNLTVNRSRCKELLEALAHWNDTRAHGRVAFLTQGSIDAARDEELLRMCARAKLRTIFVGVETPIEESLIETGKRQNVGLNLSEKLIRYVEHGISVDCGCILGFDADPPDAVERHLAFWGALPIPSVFANNLMAPESTPLYDRMKKAGRLIEKDWETTAPWAVNIVPLTRTVEEQEERVRSLMSELYEVEPFCSRLERLAELYGRADSTPTAPPSAIRISLAHKLSMRALSGLRQLEGGQRLLERAGRAATRYPAAGTALSVALVQFLQARFILRSAKVATHQT